MYIIPGFFQTEKRYWGSELLIFFEMIVCVFNFHCRIPGIGGGEKALFRLKYC